LGILEKTVMKISLELSGDDDELNAASFGKLTEKNDYKNP
jgi:hypothetical protein